MKQNIKRGDVYIINLGEVVGSEHSGIRHCVVVQNNIGNRNSTTITVVPLQKEAKPFITHVNMKDHDGNTSYAICEQVRTVSIDRIERYVGKFSNKDMFAINKALRIQLEL